MKNCPEKLTLVVNFWPTLPIFTVSAIERQRKIRPPKPGVSIYKLSDIQKSFAASRLSVVTKKCKTDIESLGWDSSDVWALVKALKTSQFRGSLWCQAGKKWLPCDHYVVANYDDGNEFGFPTEFYIKIAVSENGDVLLIISCHPSSDHV